MATRIKEGMTGAEVAQIIDNGFDNLEELNQRVETNETILDGLASKENLIIPTDEEDITSESGALKFKDREYDADNFSGKGYKILRKNIVEGKNVLTQDMVNEANTVYEIRYDFDLNGATINIPEGCTLKFEGGSFNNGNINYNNAKIINGLLTIFGDKLNINSYTKYYINVLDFYNNETDWGIVINKAIHYASKIGISEVFIPHGIYEVNTTIIVENGIILTGEFSWKENTNTVLKLANNANKTLIKIQANSSNAYGHGLKNIVLDGNWDNQQTYNDVLVINGFVGTSIENVFINKCKGSALVIGDQADLYIKNVWILYVETENYNDGAVKFITSNYNGTLYITNLYVEWVYYSNRILYGTAIKINQIGSIQINHVHLEYCNIGFDISSSQLVYINDVTISHVKSIDTNVGSIFYLGQIRTITIANVNSYNIDDDCYLIKTDSIINNQYSDIKSQRYLGLWIGTGYNENEDLNGNFISKLNIAKPTIKRKSKNIEDYNYTELKYKQELKDETLIYEGSVKFNRNSFIINFTPYNSDNFNIIECSTNINNNPNNNFIKFGKQIILLNENNVGINEGQIAYTDDNIIYRGIDNARYIKGKKYKSLYGSERPSNKDIGDEFFDTTLNKPIWWNGTKWVDYNGNDADAKTSGTTAQRPSDVITGFQYFDTDINSPVYWNGTEWIKPAADTGI